MITIFQENLHPCIVVFSLLGDQHPLSLVHPDNQMLGFLAYNPVDALGAIELPRYVILDFLIFNDNFGILNETSETSVLNAYCLFPLSMISFIYKLVPFFAKSFNS